MKITVIGLGTIGKAVLRELSTEEHTITVIDEDREKVESLIEKYDISGVVGNGACMDIQEAAGVSSSEKGRREEHGGKSQKPRLRKADNRNARAAWNINGGKPRARYRGGNIQPYQPCFGNGR